MKFQNSIRFVCLALLVTMTFVGSPLLGQDDGNVVGENGVTPQESFQTQSRQTSRAAVPQDLAIRIQLQSILDVQAQYGQFPANNRLLADIQSLLDRGVSQRRSVVRITNHGPGTLSIANPDGSVTELERNKSRTIEVGTAMVGLYSEFQYATISLQHDRNAPCQFWDEDDQVHTEIAPGFDFDGNPVVHRATLTPGLRGYHLEQ